MTKTIRMATLCLPNVPRNHMGTQIDFELTDAVAGEVLWILVERHYAKSNFRHLLPYFILLMTTVRQHLNAPSDITKVACATIFTADDSWSLSRFDHEEIRLMENLMENAKYFVVDCDSFWNENPKEILRTTWQALAKMLGDDAASTLVAIGYKLGLIRPY